ncbi:hypothetical protein GCM10025867_31090 [Frondihabitans sucicola]|uniref:Uncharacterized protein n=1 Tax=Frondihabitans sucicola TaxID=1268041 RepID=A0ABM8GRE1_9MICO|nr:hypothetical protein [Frondihabitans sucicola]BDZ50868.1 hypothetical protein GCM10025867_31090 [Frondihabitans sucicola]
MLSSSPSTRPRLGKAGFGVQPHLSHSTYAFLSYDVTVSRDGAAWLLEVAPIGGVAEARWLGEAESVARAFIADFEDADPDSLDIAITVIYPGDVALELERAESFRKTSDDALDSEWEALGNAALSLDEAGVTRRDIGDILGLAVPRVRRLLRGGPRDNQSRRDAE